MYIVSISNIIFNFFINLTVNYGYYNSNIKVLRNKRNLVLRLTQENLIEFQIQSCLSYIY